MNTLLLTPLGSTATAQPNCPAASPNCCCQAQLPSGFSLAKKMSKSLRPVVCNAGGGHPKSSLPAKLPTTYALPSESTATSRPHWLYGGGELKAAVLAHWQVPSGGNFGTKTAGTPGLKREPPRPSKIGVS